MNSKQRRRHKRQQEKIALSVIDCIDSILKELENGGSIEKMRAEFDEIKKELIKVLKTGHENKPT